MGRSLLRGQPGQLKDIIGTEQILFGSDWPHAEGLAEPRKFVLDLRRQIQRGRDPHRDGPERRKLTPPSLGTATSARAELAASRALRVDGSGQGRERAAVGGIRSGQTGRPGPRPEVTVSCSKFRNTKRSLPDESKTDRVCRLRDLRPTPYLPTVP